MTETLHSGHVVDEKVLNIFWLTSSFNFIPEDFQLILLRPMEEIMIVLVR